MSAGGVALASEKAQFSALRVGYDNNADDDIDDGGDDLVVASPFGSTSITPTHDDNGNLTFDGSFKYTYDAWNRLVKATLDDEDVVIQAAEFDGLGRRIKKTVTNSGDLDGVTVYLYQGHQIIETRDGSDQVTLQVYHGTRNIDEVVSMRIKDLGRVYVHQDANWNVIALTDLMGRPIERYWYSPYGELEAQVVTHPFDVGERSERPSVADPCGRNSEHGRERQTLGPARRLRIRRFATGGWDGDVDADDYDATTGCSGAAIGDCRVLDADADGDVDSADQTIIAAYIATLDSDTELQRIPASAHSRRGNLFAHQGLVLDAELASYQNRARQYAPKAKRFSQPDPLSYSSYAGRGYHDGLSFFNYLASTPVARLHPSGEEVATAAICCAAAGLPCCCSAVYSGRLAQLIIADTGITGSARDPMRHCMANCFTAADDGWGCAKRYWDCRETPGTPGDDADLHNNAEGRRIAGQTNDEDAECFAKCRDSYNDGSLRCPDNTPTPCTGGSVP